VISRPPVDQNKVLSRCRVARALGALLVVGLAATALTAGAGKFAFAQQPTGDVIGELANNEGIFVDGKTFKIARGNAKGDPAAQIAKLGAEEVGPGAIVFRYNDKLYLVEEAPAPLPQQAMKDFQDNWNVSYMKAMKDFQDNWNISYMTNVQSNSTFPTTKDFQGQLECLVRQGHEGFSGQLERLLLEGDEGLPGQLERLLHEELPG
jgi:hypothetical protein